MSMNHTATGRPGDTLPGLVRLSLGLASVVGTLELALRALAGDPLLQGPFLRLLLPLLLPALRLYVPLRAWALAHPVLASLLGVASLLACILLYRWCLLVWHNEIVARLTNTYFSSPVQTFPNPRFDLFTCLEGRKPGDYFVGMTPQRGPWRQFGRTRWAPVYVTDAQRSMHTHVMGKTGSGKTDSVLWPSIWQDVEDGRGVTFISAKGDQRELGTMIAVAASLKRLPELRVLCLPAWNQPLFSHRYNMVHVRPRTPGDGGGDPVTTAERVFSVLPLGENEYYRVQAEVMFTSVVRLLHGMVDADGVGYPFTMRDVSVVLKGFGDDGPWHAALMFCLERSLDKDAARSIRNQVSRLGDKVQETFTGLIGAVDKFLADLVCAYDPDIIFEDVLEGRQLVYIQAPANLFKIQAPALGRVILQDIQQQGSLRQVFRGRFSTEPFSVVVDEFYDFADNSIISSLNKLRDAGVRFTLAHQSPSDLERLGKEFAAGVWDNMRTRHILNQDNVELCERIAKSIGTGAHVEITVRRQQGALFTSLSTGDASSKLVETYKLHPNEIKNLAPRGQGYLLHGQQITPLVYACMPQLPSIASVADLVPPKDQSKARGLRLYERFVGRTSSAAAP